MTNRPDWMTVRPGGNADLLSEVLRGVRLTGALYYRVSTSCPWPPIRVPTGAAITGAFGGRTRNVISYHVVIEGTCWTGIEGDRPVQLRQGDVVVYPRGHAYFLSHDRQPLSAAADAKQLVTLLQGGVSAGSATIVHIRRRCRADDLRRRVPWIRPEEVGSAAERTAVDAVCAGMRGSSGSTGANSRWQRHGLRVQRRSALIEHAARHSGLDVRVGITSMLGTARGWITRTTTKD